jgi:hypothetical protein
MCKCIYNTNSACEKRKKKKRKDVYLEGCATTPRDEGWLQSWTNAYLDGGRDLDGEVAVPL